GRRGGHVVRDRRRGVRRQGDHDARGHRHARAAAPAAGGVPRGGGRTVRLLPTRGDRQREGAARPGAAALRRGDPHRPRPAPPPLRVAAAHHQGGAPSGSRMTTLPPSLAKHPDLDTWVRLDDTGTVTVFSGKSEHGQGLRSMLARIGAEELDVALERMRVETADTAHGLDEGLTAGSTSTQESGAALRQAAAEARARLLELAAAELGADPHELRVDDGTISVARRATTYWRLLRGRRIRVGPARPPPAQPAA